MILLLYVHMGEIHLRHPQTQWLHISMLFNLKWTVLRLMYLVLLMEFCLLSMTGRDLQRLSGNTTSKVGYMSSKEIRELGASRHSVEKFNDESIPTIQDALTMTSNSVRQIILDVKVGPPFYEKGLAEDILSIGLSIWRTANNEVVVYVVVPTDDVLELVATSMALLQAGRQSNVCFLDVIIVPRQSGLWIVKVVWNLDEFQTSETKYDVVVPAAIVEKTECRNCLIWAKSDNLARDVIKISSEITVGYIVMSEPSTGARTNLLRMKGAEVVGVYHPLIDEKLMRILHRRNKRVYAWTVDDEESMKKMLIDHVDAIVTGNPTLLQRLMQDTRTQCLEEGYSLPN